MLARPEAGRRTPAEPGLACEYRLRRQLPPSDADQPLAVLGRQLVRLPRVTVTVDCVPLREMRTGTRSPGFCVAKASTLAPSALSRSAGHISFLSRIR
jgi:hypothetical protein